METKTKIFIGIALTGLAIGGGILIYNDRKKPKLEGYDNIAKTVTFSLAGKKKTMKLDPLTGIALGANSKYTIDPIVSNNEVIGVNVKKSGKIVDHIQSTTSASQKISTTPANVKSLTAQIASVYNKGVSINNDIKKGVNVAPMDIGRWLRDKNSLIGGITAEQDSKLSKPDNIKTGDMMLWDDGMIKYLNGKGWKFSYPNYLADKDGQVYKL